MTLDAYLDRIGFSGQVRPDLATLRALHQAHLLAIPYENLDVQLGRPVTTSPADAFDKLVTRRRGGWCYEMNGLFGWALTEIGFRVTRMAGGVMRVVRGDEAIGNHLVLRVDLDEPWLADVGFGDGPQQPFRPLNGAFRDGLFDYRLEEQSDGWWRLHNHPLGGAPSFDFRLTDPDEARLSERCAWLQSSPDSMFVQNAVVQRHRPDRFLTLLGRRLRSITAEGPDDRLINSADEYVAVLKTEFDLDLPEAASLWPAILARHDILFGDNTA
jgi:N-hydroxyarylamine O-acetyltransferase